MGFRVCGLGLKVWGLGFQAQGSGFRAWGLRFRLGLKVKTFIPCASTPPPCPRCFTCSPGKRTYQRERGRARERERGSEGERESGRERASERAIEGGREGGVEREREGSREIVLGKAPASPEPYTLEAKAPPPPCVFCALPDLLLTNALFTALHLHRLHPEL